MIENLFPNQPLPTRPTKNKFINIVSVLSIFLCFLLALTFFFVFLPVKSIYSQVGKLKSQVGTIKTDINLKDLSKIRNDLSVLNQSLVTIEKQYSRLNFFRFLPYFKNYHKDGINLISIGKESVTLGSIVVDTIEPYQDFIGLKGVGSISTGTTQDRVGFLAESVETIIPKLGDIENHLNTINQLAQTIDSRRYPKSLKGINFQAQIDQSKELLSSTTSLLSDGKPLLSKLPWLLGKDAPRNYLLIFQNDAELRPTGGFWTAYGVLQVKNGAITPTISDDIYALDDLFKSTIPAPRPVKAYHINVPYLNIRDMNLSPDFPTSVQEFLKYYKIATKSKTEFDAVIGIDTQVLVSLVKVLGQIGVPGFGNFSVDPDSRCDGCPQIIYQLEWLAGRPRNFIEKDRKGFLAPVTHSILSNAMGSEKSKIPTLFQALLDDFKNKHLLVYFSDPSLQKAAASINITGTISNPSPSTDYFHLNDANMSSAKTNLFLQQKIKHEITIADNQVTHKVTVTYTNPSKASNCNLEKGDLCLNAPKYRNWFRFYVPQGSKFIKMTGSEVEPVLYQELGKEVFEGFYGDKYPLYAESSSITSIQYQSSVPYGDQYMLFLQKQPGTKPITYEIIVNGNQLTTFDWVSDTTLAIPN